MNRYFYGVQSRKRALKMLHGKVAIGATGAPTLDAAASGGISSISRTSAGLYQVTIDGKVPQLVGFQMTVLDDTTSAITHYQVTASTVSTDGIFSFLCLGPTASGDTTPAATDPANGATLLFTVLVNNTSLDA